MVVEKRLFCKVFLYGVTNFKDSIVLNKTVASEMTPSFPVNTSVEINLQHGDVHYKITRTQRFKKDLGNNVKVDGSSFCEIEKKDKTGTYFLLSKFL